jgi:hypothetical protein
MQIPNDKLRQPTSARTARVWNFAFLSVIGISLSFVICHLVLPRTGFAAAPATNPSAQIATWFVRLADRDPNVRDQARIDLMGLSRADLPAVRNYVQQHRPLSPAAAAGLRDIVTQIYLAGERYPANPDHGFLGVSLSEGSSPQLPQDRPDPAAPPPVGVIVTDRLPGLCGFRALGNGDVIVGIDQHQETPLRNVENLKAVIADLRAGEDLRLEIFRGGRVVTVTLKLSARPLEVELNPNDLMFFQREKQRRLDLADDYWQREFAPLIDDGVS